MATAKTQETIHVLTRNEAWKLFDDEARSRLNLSGKEFLAAWHAGKFLESKENKAAVELSMLLPIVEAS